MVDLERLSQRGRFAYELGRMRAAGLIAVYLVPAAVICLATSRRKETCACLSVGLLLVAVGLRWRSRRGTDDVTTGLIAGSIPLVVALAMRCTVCGGPLCMTLQVLGGVAAGGWVAVRAHRNGSPLTSWLTAAAVATVAASIGGVSLGFAGLTMAVIGIALGSGVGALVTAGR